MKKLAKEKRKRGEFQGALVLDEIDDGYSQKNLNLFPLPPPPSSFTTGLHLAARLRGPGVHPAGPATLPGPGRQGAPLGAAGEERPRAQGADDGCRRQGSAEETCGELREERRTIFLFALSFFPPPHFIHYSARCVFADERGRESGQFLFIFRFSSSSLTTNGDSDGDDDKNFSFSFLANDERIFFKKTSYP